MATWPHGHLEPASILSGCLKDKGNSKTRSCKGALEGPCGSTPLRHSSRLKIRDSLLIGSQAGARKQFGNLSNVCMSCLLPSPSLHVSIDDHIDGRIVSTAVAHKQLQCAQCVQDHSRWQIVVPQSCTRARYSWPPLYMQPTRYLADPFHQGQCCTPLDMRLPL